MNENVLSDSKIVDEPGILDRDEPLPESDLTRRSAGDEASAEGDEASAEGDGASAGEMLADERGDAEVVAGPALPPVPAEDVLPFAKPKCSTCLGRGKLVYHHPGSKKAVEKVCPCAVRRFVAANREHLLIDKGGRLFYIGEPESLDAKLDEKSDAERDAEQAASEVGEPAGPSDYIKDRIRGMYVKIAQYTTDLVEIDERYARMSDPIGAELEAVKVERAAESGRLQGLSDKHATMLKDRDLMAAEILDLEEKLKLVKHRKLEQGFAIAGLEEDIADAETAALPGIRKQHGVEERLVDVGRKRGKARRPAEQKKASLEKRILHLAAVNDLTSEVLAVLAKVAEEEL